MPGVAIHFCSREGSEGCLLEVGEFEGERLHALADAISPRFAFEPRT